MVNDTQEALHQRNWINEKITYDTVWCLTKSSQKLQLLNMPSLHSHQILKSNLYHMGTWKPELHDFWCIWNHVFSCLSTTLLSMLVLLGDFRPVGFHGKSLLHKPALSHHQSLQHGQNCLAWAVICNVKRAHCLCKPQGHAGQLMTGFNSVYCVTASSFLDN